MYFDIRPLEHRFAVLAEFDLLCQFRQLARPLVQFGFQIVDQFKSQDEGDGEGLSWQRLQAFSTRIGCTAVTIPPGTQLLEEVETWPAEDQEELAEYAREIRGRRTGVHRLSDDERAGIERGLEDMRAGRFATDEEIATVFRRARSFRA